MLCLVLSVMQGCQSTKNTVMTGVVDNRQEEVLRPVCLSSMSRQKNGSICIRKSRDSTMNPGMNTDCLCFG